MDFLPETFQMNTFRALGLTMSILTMMLACQGNQSSTQETEDEREVNTDSQNQKIEADYEGIYTEGSDYQEFKDCGSWRLYQIVDSNQSLSAKYDSLGLQDGKPMHVHFNGETENMSQGSSGASSMQQIHVDEVLEVAKFDGQTTCQPPWEKVFEFIGNEPFWSLKISADSIVFNHFERETVAFPFAEPQWEDSVWVFETEKDNQRLTARVSEDDCQDSMSGFRYEMSVQLQTSGESFEGCGGWSGRENSQREM